jgi:hypothetical protein
MKRLTSQTSYKDLTKLSPTALATLKAKMAFSIDYNPKEKRHITATIEQAQQWHINRRKKK